MTYSGDGEVSAILRPAAAAGDFGVGSMTGAIVVDATTTEGRYSLYRIHLEPQAPGAQPHFHRTFAESFHVLAGVVEWFNGADWVQGHPGDHLFIPEGGIHGFRNAADEPASMLMMTTPGVAREEYFRAIARIVETGQALSPEEFTQLLVRYDQYMV